MRLHSQDAAEKVRRNVAATAAAFIAALAVLPLGASAQSPCSDACTEARAAGLIITTIEKNGAWPGSIPAKLRECMHYPPDQALPTEDQIVFDYMMEADSFVPIALTTLHALGNSQDPILIQTPTGGGELGVGPGCTHADLEAVKQWLTLAVLKRSTNETPPDRLSRNDLTDYSSELDYRLINEYRVRAIIAECKMRMAHSTGSTSLIGPTPLTFETVAFYKLTRFTLLGPIHFLIPIGNIPRTRLLRGTADEADRNGDVVRTLTSVTHRTAGRINSLLEPYEHALLPLRAQPFASELTFTVDGTAVKQSDWVSQVVHSTAPECPWPSASVYQWDEPRGAYLQDHRHFQGQSPFVCFIGFGTPWPQ